MRKPDDLGERKHSPKTKTPNFDFFFVDDHLN